MKRAAGFLVLSALAFAADGQPIPHEVLEVSAPIMADLVKATEAFAHETIYPSTQEKRVEFVERYTYTFDFLLTECAKHDPAITLPSDERPVLTLDEVRTNYDRVAQCAYWSYGSKPYWTPQLVLDVDICGSKLGEGWRLPTQDDLEQMRPAELRFFKEALTFPRSATPDDGTGPDPRVWPLYFALDIFVRDNAGGIAHGSLDPDAPARVQPLATESLKDLYTGNNHRPYLVVRCVRRSPVVAM